MCLRTRHWLGEDEVSSVGSYVCPGYEERCSGGETYSPQTADTEAGAAVLNALAFARREFPAKQQPVEIVVWLIRENGSQGPLALLPESTWDQMGRPAVYLNGSGRDQLAFQAAHEAFHVLWTPKDVLHWAHEVGATIFSLAHLDAAGARDTLFRTYRADLIERAREGSNDFPVENLMRARQPYPKGFYDRAILFALQLVEIVGPAGYYGIAKPGPSGQPDFWGWADTKPAKLRRLIESIAHPRNETA
jgi:hypothetical protein